MDGEAMSPDSLLNQCLPNCQAKNWQQLDRQLEQLVKLFKTDENRYSVNSEHLIQLNLLTKAIDEAFDQDKSDHYFNVYSNVFRLLRNCCAGCPKNCLLIAGFDDLINHLCFWLEYNVYQASWENINPSFLTSIRCCLQFFANLAAGSSTHNDVVRNCIWTKIDFDLFRKLLTSPDASIRKTTTAIIYNCLLDEKLLDDILKDNVAVMYLIDLMTNDIVLSDQPSEWSLFTLHRILEENVSLSEILDKLSVKNSLALLDVIIEMVKEDNQVEKNQLRIPESNLVTIFSQMQENLKDICENRCDSWTSDDCQRVVKLISIVGEIASNEKNRLRLLDDVNLFKLATESLKKLHLIYKAQTLSSSDGDAPMDVDDDNNFKMTLVNLKKDLVRLIANLAHKRPALKEIANTIDAVPLILDLYRIDKENPFIREWAILALHNLLEGNEANQRIIANLTQHEIIADEVLIDRLGFKIEGDKVVPKNLPPPPPPPPHSTP